MEKMSDIFKSIRSVAKKSPGSIALVSPRAALSYEGLADAIENIASNALAEGLRPGNRVHVRCENPELKQLMVLGLMRAGMVVGMARGPEIYARHEIEFDALIADKSEPTDNQFKVKKRIPLVRNWAHKTKNIKPAPRNLSYALMVSSSGSTGQRKLEYVTDKNLEYRAAIGGDRKAGGKKRHLNALGGHSLISYVQTLNVLVSGGIVFRMGAVDARQFIEYVDIYRPNHAYMAPITMTAVLDEIENRPSSFVKVEDVVVGGSYLSPKVRERAERLLCDRVFVGYGASEIGRVAIGSSDEFGHSDGILGKVYDGVEVQVLDEDGNVLPTGSTGEIRVRPPENAPVGYVFADKVTSCMRDGWFYPGDLGRMDEAGVLHFEGRKSEVINVGGNKYDPERIEATLKQIDGVEDVAVAPVVGPDGFDVIAALIVKSASFKPDHINKWLAERRENFEISESRLVEAIPRNADGKISRADVRKHFEGAR